MNKTLRMLRVAAVVATAGMCFQLGSCVTGGLRYAASYNPCGSILNCDPAQYEYLTEYDGPGIDIDYDPTCTWPPFCDGGQ